MPTGQLIMGDLGRASTLYAYGVRNLNVIDQSLPAKSQLLPFFQGPYYNRDEEFLEFFANEGNNPGVIDQPINADIPATTKNTYTAQRQRIFWDMYASSIGDDVKEFSLPRVMDMESVASLRHFTKVTDFKIIRELVAGASANTTNAAASGVWDQASHVEQDITAALQDLATSTGIAHSEAKNILVLFPTKVFTALYGLDFIKNVNQSIVDHLGNSYKNMVFIDITPSLNSKGERKIDISDGTSSDALTTNALVVYSGPETLDVGEFVPKSIARVVTASNGIFKGYTTATRRCFGCKTVPMFGESTTTPRIAKITGVCSA